MMQTSHEISCVVADDDADSNASKNLQAENSVKESTNELKASIKSTLPSDLSLNIPKKHVHFSTPDSSSSGRTSPWSIFRSLSFKKKNVPDGESGSLLDPAVQPEIPVVTKFKSIFNFSRSKSLPVKRGPDLSPSINSPVSARTNGEQQKSQTRGVKPSVSRSLSAPLRNIVIVRSVSFADHKDTDQIVSADEDETSPVGVEDDEEIDEEEAVCRICFGECDEGNQLKMECSCKGALKLVHEKCAVKWFTDKGNKICELCGKEVTNLPVKLFRMRSCVQRQNPTARTQQGLDSRTISVWEDVVRLVLVSTICYFLLIEQLLITELKTQAVMIAAPFALTFGLLSSTFAVIIAKEYISRYAVVEFALVAMTFYLLYSLLHLVAIYAVMLSSVIGFGLAMALNALYIRYTVWRVQTPQGYRAI